MVTVYVDGRLRHASAGLADHSPAATPVNRIGGGFAGELDEVRLWTVALAQTDIWRFAETYGIRGDIPRFPDTPLANPLAVTDFNLRTDITPSPMAWSPRAGFNWALGAGSGGRQSQVRGGVGLFSGRTPYVWLSNQYGNTGVDYINFRCPNQATSPTFVAQP